MKREEVDQLVLEGLLPGDPGKIDLIETHISWILLGKDWAYKIKRPVHYTFLDFSSLEKRKFYCGREIELNKRLTEGIYMDVQPVKKRGEHHFIGDGQGEVMDYAVRMRRMDGKKQMDFLLLNNQVSAGDLFNLANKIAAFHQRADIIPDKNIADIPNKFSDLGKETDYMIQVGLPAYGEIIQDAIKKSDVFYQQNELAFQQRQNQNGPFGQENLFG